MLALTGAFVSTVLVELPYERRLEPATQEAIRNYDGNEQARENYISQEQAMTLFARVLVGGFGAVVGALVYFVPIGLYRLPGALAVARRRNEGHILPPTLRRFLLAIARWGLHDERDDE